MAMVLSTAELLGFDSYIPAYTQARGQAILKGVNYASAAAGIRDETGQQLVRTLSFFHNSSCYTCLIGRQNK